MTIVLNGSTGITSVNGSAAAPSVTGTDTDTGIVYGTNTLSLATGGTTALTANSSQGIQVLNTIGVGNTTPSTSGAGISFPATQNASSDANTLDDYEEGTWTPSLISTGTAPTVTTYQTQQGIYTKIGNLVVVTFSVRATLSAIGTGTPVVRGLPFAPAGYLEGIALGLRTLLTQIPTNGIYVQAPTDVYFDGAVYTLAAGAYITFTVSYRV